MTLLLVRGQKVQCPLLFHVSEIQVVFLSEGSPLHLGPGKYIHPDHHSQQQRELPTGEQLERAQLEVEAY